MTVHLDPEQYGWRATAAADDPASTCSFPRCEEMTAAVIRRSSRGGKPHTAQRRQGYCPTHLRRHGVLVDDHGGLSFSPETIATLLRIRRLPTRVRVFTGGVVT